MLVRGLRQAEARIRRFGMNIQSIGRRLATLGIGFSIPFAASIKTFAEFDDRMRAVKAAVSATQQEFDQLTAKAKLLGRTTSFTATQVAGAMLELARAGFDPKMIDQAIASMLDLSRATGTDLALATEMAVNTMYSFELPASEMTRVCDVMVAAANGAAMTLTDLGYSLSYCSPIAKEFGLSVEETCKAIGVLSNYGIKASQAGTALRRILVNLAEPAIQRRLRGLGVSVVDIQTGRMREVSAILRDLGQATKNLPQDKKLTLFRELFDLWAMAAGAKMTVAQFDKLYEEIDKAGGVARAVAKEMDSGIGGSLRRMWSAIEGVAIAIGDALAPGLKSLTDRLVTATGGMIKYLEKNKELIVKSAKFTAAVIGIGAAIFGLGTGFLLLSKLIGVTAAVLTGVFSVLLFPVNLIGKILNGLLWTAAAIINVFGGVTRTVLSVVKVLTSMGSVIFTVLSGLGTIAMNLMFGIGRALLVLASGIIGGVGILVRGIVVVLSALAPIVGTVVSLLGTALYAITTGLITGIGMIGSLISSLFPVVAAGLSAMLGTLSFAFTVIAAGCAAAFSAISFVVQSAFLSVGAAIVAGLQTAFAAIGTVLLPILATIGGFLSTLLSVIGTAIVGIGTFIISSLAAIGTAIAASISAAITSIVTSTVILFAHVVGLTSAFLGHMIAAIGSAVAGVLASMSPILVVLGTLALAAGAVYLLVSNLGTLGNAIGAVFIQAFQVVSNCLTWIMDGVIALGGHVLLAFIDCLGSITGAVWNMAKRVGSIVAVAVGSAVEGIRSVFAAAWNGMVGLFTTVFNTLAEIVTGFGNFFYTVFDNIGTAIDWVKGRFGELCSFAVEVYGAIVAALSRGDIEAAIGVIWATIKLIWVQGATSLLKTWYWLVETVQLAWATCVFKLSELLTKAWFGVQEFWTESVYTMQTLWIGFTDTVVSAWKSVEQSIAQGIGWIIAKMQGLDPSEMAKTLSEDYTRQASQRQADSSKQLSEIQTQRDQKMAALQTDKEGTLGILRSDFEKQASSRNAEHDTKIAAQEAELAKAKEAYQEAINRAKNPAPAVPGDKQESLGEKLKRKIQEITQGFNMDLGEKVSVTGSFSASAISAMGAGSTMDRVAKATEKSEKHLEKIANKDAKADGNPDEKKKEQGKEPGQDDPTLNEMKAQTRILRDILTKGGVFV